MFVVLYRGVFVGILGLIPLYLIYQSLPTEALLRLSTLFAAAQGRPIDSSAVKRIERATEAYAVIQQHPFGLGWAASGWTHNDILQIAVDLGVIAVIIFVVGYGVLALRLAKKIISLRNMRAKAPFQVSLGLFLGFIGSGFLYAAQGITWQVFLVLPAWLIWAISHHWVSEPSIITLQENKNAAENIRPAPRIQQRAYDPRDPRVRLLGRRTPRR
jgi:O-antigen ligase